MTTSRRRPVRWGQHFLQDSTIAESIVDWAEIEGKRVLEVGPGRGALTRFLKARAAFLYLVEIDPRIVAELRSQYGDDDTVVVIDGDILELDMEDSIRGPVHVVSNLPYESGTAIVNALLDAGSLVSEMVVMLQHEVCERLLAGPGTKKYGVLSIMTAIRADVEPGLKIPPSAFRPRPKVDSQVVRIRPLARPRFDIGRPAVFADLVHTVFRHRRKMLGNTLQPWLVSKVGPRDAHRFLETAGIDQALRPERIELESFARLSSLVSAGERHDA